MPGPSGRDGLAFLDGYLFRIMVDILKSEGAEAGLYSYYVARIEGGYALSNYDRVLYEFILAHFDKQKRRVVHAGIGLGTLTSILSQAGYTVAGIEWDGARRKAAARIRDALSQAWPAVAERYELMGGEYPTVVAETPWMTSDTVLVFTNCGAGWSEELTDRIIASFLSVGDVILDARLFGKTRESPVDRDDLVKRIEAQGLTATKIAETPSGSYYHHVQSRRSTQ